MSVPTRTVSFIEPDSEAGVLTLGDNQIDPAYEEDVTVPLAINQIDVPFTFSTVKAGLWEWQEGPLLENLVDPNPFAPELITISITTSGGRVLLTGVPDTANYVLRGRVRVTTATLASGATVTPTQIFNVDENRLQTVQIRGTGGNYTLEILD